MAAAEKRGGLFGNGREAARKSRAFATGAGRGAVIAGLVCATMLEDGLHLPFLANHASQ
jgi:hypothetical protein